MGYESIAYEVNAPTVMSETIGGETIVVNLTTGCYYSLEGSGVEIWHAVTSGSSSGAIADTLGERYEGDPAEMQAAVTQLIDELRREELIVPANGVANGVGNGAVGAATSTDAERRPFASPRLHKFTDMKDIIMLDPVHEVDARGWPHPAPPADDASSS